MKTVFQNKLEGLLRMLPEIVATTKARKARAKAKAKARKVRRRPVPRPVMVFAFGVVPEGIAPRIAQQLW